MTVAVDASQVTFLEQIAHAITEQSFVRVTLGKVRTGSDARKCVITPVLVRGETQLRFVTSLERKDITEIKAIADAVPEISGLIGRSFLSATLFTTGQDLTLTYNKRNEPLLNRSKPTFATAAVSKHNRSKAYAVEPSRPYLHHLGVTLDDGRIKPSMHPKFKQIAHFIEIVDDVVRSSPLRDAPMVSAIDIGSGKGYLTFALYDFLTTRLGKVCAFTGIELRADLVAMCNELAGRLDFQGLTFAATQAAATDVTPVDLVVALHACDTATDDAIYRGIAGGAAIIFCAPCCQHEIAPQLGDANAAIRGLVKYGLFKQRQADLVTDAARALLMESSGYKVKIIEFVSTEHTAKNLLIAGTKSDDVDRDAARRQYQELKQFAGFKTHSLEKALAKL